jgi:hypothetical protein
MIVVILPAYLALIQGKPFPQNYCPPPRDLHELFVPPCDLN